METGRRGGAGPLRGFEDLIAGAYPQGLPQFISMVEQVAGHPEVERGLVGAMEYVETGMRIGGP